MDTPRITAAEYVSDYKLKVAFSDGKTGVIDLEDELWGEVFEPLKDLKKFKAFKLDTEMSTISWSTGADLAPEYLYQACA